MEIVKRLREEKLLSSELVVEEAFRKLGLTKNQVTSENVRKNFNRYLYQAFTKTLEVLENYEALVYEEALKQVCDIHIGDFKEGLIIFRKFEDPLEGLRAAVSQVIFPRLYEEMWEIFQSRAQSRKARGGKDWELQLATLFNLMDVPYERHMKKYRLDFIFPNEDYFKRYRQRSFVVSAKRTLRERWREVVEELVGYRAPNVYLATADTGISEDTAKKITDYGIHLAVWDEVKKEDFERIPSVIGFSRLAEDIDLYDGQHWRKRGQLRFV